MYETVISQVINAPVEKVFNAWADPKELSVWFTTNAQQNFTVGGKYSNGDMDEGEFIEIVKDKKISFTWESKDHCPGTFVIVEFKNVTPGITQITILHTKLESEEHVSGMNEGWTWAAYSLKSYLETGKPIDYAAWKRTIMEK
ncbi:MAG: SRPBCC domain-containing protein [Ignavibacteria bacterium]|nr:SRPBCC domain-containing protein [Ignavibacteria bacterium]